VRRSRAIGLTAAALLGLEGGAAAQTVGIDVNVTGNVLYDSNIVRASKAVADARGLTQEDVRFTPGLGLEMSIPRGRHRFYADALASYDFHARNTRLNRERLQGRTGVQSGFGRCVSRIDASFARRQSELDDLLLGPVENAETTAAFVADLSCPREAGFYPTLSTGYRSIRNSNEQRRSSDFDSFEVEAGVGYSRPTLGQLGLVARYVTVEFPNRAVGAGPDLAEDRFEVIQLGGRFSRELGSLVRGSATAGYSSVRRDAGGDAFEGVTFALDLRFRPSARLRPRIAAEKRVSPSNRIGILYQVEEICRMEADYSFSPAARFTFGGTDRRRSYEAAAFFPAPVVLDEKTNALFATLAVDVTQRASLTLDALWERRDTGVPLFNYESTRVGLSTRLSF